MSKFRRAPRPWSMVFADSHTTPRFFPSTGWMDASGVQEGRTVMEVRESGQYFQATFTYQTCNVENAPDAAATTPETYQSGDGVQFPTAIASYTTGGKQLVRGGWSCKLSQAGSMVFARIGGVWEIKVD